jgi:uncharacterized membrane protein YbhN (UPF0104 family)
VKIVILSVLNWLSMFLEYKFAIMIFGISNVSFPAIFLIITMMGVAYLFPIPLALGVLEAGQMSTFNALDLNPAAGLGLSMVIRFRDLGWTVLSFIILGVYGFSFKKAYQETIEEGTIKPVEELDNKTNKRTKQRKTKRKETNKKTNKKETKNKQ